MEGFFFFVPVVVVLLSTAEQEKKRQIRGYRLAASLEPSTSTSTPRAGRARRVPCPVEKTRGNAGGRKREEASKQGSKNENAFAALATRERKKALGVKLLSFSQAYRAPSPLLASSTPLVAREGAPAMDSSNPYRKSSGICCTACSRTTNRHPFFFFFFAFLDSEVFRRTTSSDKGEK